jgi:ABC-type hemin transport system ATPase subunit
MPCRRHGQIAAIKILRILPVGGQKLLVVCHDLSLSAVYALYYTIHI